MWRTIPAASLAGMPHVIKTVGGPRIVAPIVATHTTRIVATHTTRIVATHATRIVATHATRIVANRMGNGGVGGDRTWFVANRSRAGSNRGR